MNFTAGQGSPERLWQRLCQKLRSIAEYCNFGAMLDVILRDRLVCGINNSQIQKRLLSEKTLKYQNALKLALGIEAAALSLKMTLQGATQVGEGSTPSSG